MCWLRGWQQSLEEASGSRVGLHMSSHGRPGVCKAPHGAQGRAWLVWVASSSPHIAIGASRLPAEVGLLGLLRLVLRFLTRCALRSGAERDAVRSPEP